MIYTVTFAPALDYVMYVPDFKPGLVNRTEREDIHPGGKGVNVSIVLKNLGVPSVALGFVAGFTGREIVRRLEEMQVITDFIETPGLSRINVKLKGGTETDVNAQGAPVSQAALEQLFAKLEKLERGDFLVLAGHPSGLPEDIYEQILARLSGRGVHAVVDCTGEYLLNTLKYRPFLIKPNHHELAELFGKTVLTRAELAECAMKLQTRGARNVIVSMAGDGAAAALEDGNVYFCPAPKGTVVDSVGAGDSVVAGFLSGYLESGGLEHAFRKGVAAGSATAFSAGLATAEQVEVLADGQ